MKRIEGKSIGTVAKKLLRRYDAHRITASAVVSAWEGHLIDAAEFGAIIGEAS